MQHFKYAVLEKWIFEIFRGSCNDSVIHLDNSNSWNRNWRLRLEVDVGDI